MTFVSKIFGKHQRLLTCSPCGVRLDLTGNLCPPVRTIESLCPLKTIAGTEGRQADFTKRLDAGLLK